MAWLPDAPVCLRLRSLLCKVIRQSRSRLARKPNLVTIQYKRAEKLSVADQTVLAYFDSLPFLLVQVLIEIYSVINILGIIQKYINRNEVAQE